MLQEIAYFHCVIIFTATRCFTAIFIVVVLWFLLFQNFKFVISWLWVVTTILDNCFVLLVYHMLHTFGFSALSCGICSSDVVRMVSIFREAEDIHSRESSNTYINSLGSYFIDSNLLVDLSNTSIGSLDSNYSSDASMIRSFLAAKPV